MEQVKTINSGIHIKYLREYFAGIADHYSGDEYFCGQVLIRLLPLDNQVHGTIALPRTEIVFSGMADDVEKQMHLYRCNQSSKIGHFPPQTIPLFSRSLSDECESL